MDICKSRDNYQNLPDEGKRKEDGRDNERRRREHPEKYREEKSPCWKNRYE